MRAGECLRHRPIFRASSSASAIAAIAPRSSRGEITGGRIDLAAYVQRFGATGLTYLDDKVTEFFSPHAAGKSVMLLAALWDRDGAALGLAS